jgi:hypothetical protein
MPPRAGVFSALGKMRICVDLFPRCFQRIALIPVRLLDYLLNLFLVLQHCAEHLFEARLALLDAEKKWSTLWRIESRDSCQYAHVDHVDHFLVHFLLHAPLLLLQLLRAILQLANVNLAKITLRSLLAEQT